VDKRPSRSDGPHDRGRDHLGLPIPGPGRVAGPRPGLRHRPRLRRAPRGAAMANAVPGHHRRLACRPDSLQDQPAPPHPGTKHLVSRHLADGESIRAVAAEWRVSVSTVHRCLQRHPAADGRPRPVSARRVRSPAARVRWAKGAAGPPAGKVRQTKPDRPCPAMLRPTACRDRSPSRSVPAGRRAVPS
jgi:hypothetical protein